MRSILRVLALGAALGAALAGTSRAAEPLDVVASFSILADMAREVGGERVRVATLVGSDGDAHAYEPAPANAKSIAEADLVLVNVLGFEGWLPRLLEASGYRGPVVTASKGVVPLGWDPHAWQSLANGRTYARNIAAALAAADPTGADIYRDRTETYIGRLEAQHERVRVAIAGLPVQRRRLVMSHHAFAYFADAYGLEILAPKGVSTDEVSAADVAALIRQIRAESVSTFFVENVSDPRLLEQIARETGAQPGGTLYTDALSGPDGPVPTYERMFQHNLEVLLSALTP